MTGGGEFQVMNVYRGESQRASGTLKTTVYIFHQIDNVEDGLPLIHHPSGCPLCLFAKLNVVFASISGPPTRWRSPVSRSSTVIIFIGDLENLRGQRRRRLTLRNGRRSVRNPRRIDNLLTLNSSDSPSRFYPVSYERESMFCIRGRSP